MPVGCWVPLQPFEDLIRDLLDAAQSDSDGGQIFGCDPGPIVGVAAGREVFGPAAPCPGPGAAYSG